VNLVIFAKKLVAALVLQQLDCDPGVDTEVVALVKQKVMY